MSTQPDRINPQSPPETPEQPVFDPPTQPDEAQPLAPDTDHPGRGPDEVPNLPGSNRGAVERALASKSPGQQQ